MTTYEILTLIAIVGIAVQQGWQVYNQKKKDKAHDRLAEQVKKCETHKEQTNANTDAINLLVQSKAAASEISEIKIKVATIDTNVMHLMNSQERIEEKMFKHNEDNSLWKQ